MRRAAARQLLSIEEACVAKDLNEILEMVMKETGMADDDFRAWEALASEGIRCDVLRLELLNHQEPEEQRKDQQTRTLEWMLGVFYASSYLVEIQKRMIAYNLRENRKLVAHSSTFTSRVEDPQEQSGFDRAVSSRTILKFWFLDANAASEEDYAASHWDSEATMRIVDDEFTAEILLAPSSKTNKEMSISSEMLLQPDIRLYPDLPATTTFVNSEQRLLKSAPDDISGKDREAAKQALEDYLSEPTQDPDKIPNVFFDRSISM